MLCSALARGVLYALVASSQPEDAVTSHLPVATLSGYSFFRGQGSSGGGTKVIGVGSRRFLSASWKTRSKPGTENGLFRPRVGSQRLQESPAAILSRQKRGFGQVEGRFRNGQEASPPSAPQKDTFCSDHVYLEAPMPQQAYSKDLGWEFLQAADVITNLIRSCNHPAEAPETWLR